MQRKPAEPFANQGGVIVMAHRGERGHAPENTMIAFERAVKLGVDALETDIHQTKDGVLVVCHDETVDRMTDGQGLIKEMTLAELQELDAGYRFTAVSDQTTPYRGQGHTIPTLEELFATYPDYWINIDIKQSEPNIVPQFVEMVRHHNMANKVMVGSFNHSTVQQLRRLAPEIATAASENEVRQMVLLSKIWLGGFYRGKVDAFQVPEWNDSETIRVVSPAFVEAAHKTNTAVHVWTINEVDDMQRLIDWGVDAIMTDYPARALKLLGRLEESE